MNTLLYIIIFFMGTVFGSFLTLATYRIPLNQDITHKRSYCPNCHHKLGFWDLIPLFSYIFLGAKCRYCKKKISPRYFIIELLTGISFVILAKMLNMNIYYLDFITIMEFIFGVLYIIFLFLMAGIDLEHKKIDNRVLIYGISIAIAKIAYQYIMCTYNGVHYNLNRIIIYLFAIVIVNIVSIQKLNIKYDYIYGLVIEVIIMSLFTYEITTIITIIYTLLIIAIKILLDKTINKTKIEKNKNKFKGYEEKTTIAFYLAVVNAIVVIFSYLSSIIVI